MWPFLLALLGGAGGATAGVGAAAGAEAAGAGAAAGGATAGAAGGMSLGNMTKFADLLKAPTPKPTNDDDFPPLAARNLDLLTTNLGFGGGPQRGNYP